EFEEGILADRFDAAVHSAKDMPMELLEGLEVVAVLPRTDAEDVFVTVKGRAITNNPMVVGTGSLRRQLQIIEQKDAVCKLIRGNVDTRLGKLYDGQYDAIILAAAGLKRLGLFEDDRFEFEYLPTKNFTPAGGQAIIAIEAKENSEFADLFSKINHEASALALKVERYVLECLGAGCNEAVGAFSYLEEDKLVIQLLKETKSELVRREIAGDPKDYRMLVQKLVENMDQGMVYLVGAGPGDPELLTLKGKRLLSQADVLVYDRLASPEFLNMVPETCEKIYVGKKPGNHSMVQEEINQVLVRHACMGKTIVRLKGGDPFVFGRGGEEILELEKHGIPYEVVSGVTSPVAALAHAGIPITHRGIGQSFHVITGHTAIKEKGIGMLDKETDTLTDGFAEYAKLQGTLVFLMGLKNLDLIVDRLIQNGKDPKTPSAIVTDGTLPSMRCVRSTLKDLPRTAKEHGLKSPGIIVVGSVAEFDMTTRKNLALSGLSVGVTGTDAIYKKLASKLYTEGASVSRIGNSHIVPMNLAQLAQTVKEISSYQWIVFTSRNAIDLFFHTTKTEKIDMRSFSHVKFAVVGRGTGDYLEQYGFYADYMPEVFTTESLAMGLCKIVNKQERVLIPRAFQGSKLLTEILDQAHIEYVDLSIYDVKVDKSSADSLQGLDYLTFESGSGVRGFFEHEKEEKVKILNHSVYPICIGQVTAGVLKEFGVTRALVARDFTADGICDILKETGGEHVSENPGR
ncbi:MAG: uroporphyrinogen-III C-methyltransferase, partial [Lachnospiraceae bacterium]|nr:uroporphyrinogen-III C-methyltransferase [Lachnospiraceae bacterium]